MSIVVVNDRQLLLDGLAGNLRARRAELGYSQDAMAEVIGVDRSYYGRLERSMINPRLTTLATVAAGMNCSIGDLIEGL